MGLKKAVEEQQAAYEAEIRHTKLPREQQVFGLVDQRLGGTRMRVRCLDGKMRLCRIPGRLKRRLWDREGDTVLVGPWELGGDKKGDILYKYTRAQTQWLRKKGYVKDIHEFARKAREGLNIVDKEEDFDTRPKIINLLDLTVVLAVENGQKIAYASYSLNIKEPKELCLNLSLDFTNTTTGPMPVFWKPRPM